MGGFSLAKSMRKIAPAFCTGSAIILLSPSLSLYQRLVLWGECIPVFFSMVACLFLIERRFVRPYVIRFCWNVRNNPKRISQAIFWMIALDIGLLFALCLSVYWASFIGVVPYFVGVVLLARSHGLLFSRVSLQRRLQAADVRNANYSRIEHW